VLLGAVGALAVLGQLHVAAHRRSRCGLVALHGSRLRRTSVAGSAAGRRNGTVAICSNDPAFVMPETRHASLRSSVLHR